MSKTVLVSGAASGIGFGIAEDLARKGHRVWLSDVNAEAVEKSCQKLEQSGLSVNGIVLDVTSDADMSHLLETLGETAVDVLINNAGIQHVAALEEFPIKQWDRLIQIMLVGVARLTQTLLPGMKEQNFGRIINIGSIHSLVASPYKSAYIAAKHGLLGFSKTMALETAEVDVTINTLCPSYVDTPLVRSQISAQAKKHGISEEKVVSDIMLAPMPKGRFIALEELAGSCEFLMSPAARNITGQAIALDGGWTAR